MLSSGVKKFHTLLKRSVRWILRRVGFMAHAQVQPAVDWRAYANRIASSPEFSMLEFHPLAGKIEGDKQYFWDGSFTTFPWGSEDLQMVMELVKGAGEPQEILPFLDVVKSLPEDAITVELGAGWALYSIMVGKRLPKATMILVEANPRILEITKTNIERNGLAGRSIIIHGAATDRDGDIVRFSEDGYGSYIKSDGPYQVTTVSVDGIMQRLDIPRVNMVHMDVQGAEGRVILGMNKALRCGAIDYVFTETHSHELHLACETALNNLGYETLVSLDVDQSVSAGGILVCARRGIKNPLTG